MSKENYPHYYRDVRHLTHIDVYRILRLFCIDDPCVAHAFKKLLALGQRGAKDAEKDAREVIASMERWLEMREEDENMVSAARPSLKEAYILTDVIKGE